MKIVVLGAGKHHVPLLESLSDKFIVHGVSGHNGESVRKAVNYFRIIDTKNKEAVLEYSKENQIDLIYPVGSEAAMVTAAWVSDKLGLPSFVTPEVASVCKARKELIDISEKETFQIIKDPAEIDDLELPLIIEPIGRRDQRGIYLINHEYEIESKFQSALRFSTCDYIVVKNYVEDPAISVTIYMVDGEICFSFISDRIACSDPSGGLTHRHRVPSQFVKEKSERHIHQMITETVDTIGIRNGPVFFLIHLKENAPFLKRVFPGFDNYDLGRIINIATGVDLLEKTITHLVGHSVRDLQSHYTK